jgi:regulatory protein
VPPGHRSATDRDGARAASDGDSSPESPTDAARAVVLRRLSFGPRTRAQLREAILDKDIPEAVADAVLDRFTEVGLVDDADFAREWVRIRHRDKGLSRRALADELRRKGVPRDLADEALSTLDGDDERAAARALVERKLPGTVGLEYPKRVNRLMGMLARKGYGAGLAGEVVREALATSDDHVGDAVD